MNYKMQYIMKYKINLFVFWVSGTAYNIVRTVFVFLGIGAFFVAGSTEPDSRVAIFCFALTVGWLGFGYLLFGMHYSRTEEYYHEVKSYKIHGCGPHLEDISKPMKALAIFTGFILFTAYLYLMYLIASFLVQWVFL